MAIHTKVTAQGQVSVPADVRRKLGVGPGSVLEWTLEDERAVVRRAGRFSSQDIHKALFRDKSPSTRSVPELKDGIRKAMRKRHARG